MKILFCGDSTMAGAMWTPAGYVISAYNMPAIVGGMLGGQAVCENVAIGGTTSPQWLYGQGSVAQTWEARMTATDANIVAINTAINDAYDPGLTYQDHQWCYAEFARIAREHGRTPVFFTPTPINTAHLSRLWEFQHAMRATALSAGVPVVNLWDAVIAAAPQWPTLLPDGVHPGDDLYRLMGHIAYVALKPSF